MLCGACKALNGTNVYYGCCTLRIDFSKLSTLNVRYNNEKSRDFTDPTLSAGNVAVSPFSVSVLGYGTGTNCKLTYNDISHY